MKKFISTLLIAALIFSTTACSNSIKTNLTGTAEDVLTKLLEDIAASGIEMPMAGPNETITADTAQNSIGITQADFESYITSASSSSAAISTFAHQIAIIEAKDAASATEIKKLITVTPDNPDDGGYNPMKWICVIPDECIVVESGPYVLLIASKTDLVTAGTDAFTAAAGEIGEINTFYERAE